MKLKNIFIICDKAKGFQLPPPAENKTNSDIVNIINSNKKEGKEKRFNFSKILSLSEFEILVCLDIFYSLSSSLAISADIFTAGVLVFECSVIIDIVYLGLSDGTYPTNNP